MNAVRHAATGRPKLRPTNGMRPLGKPSAGGRPMNGKTGPTKG